MILFLLSLFQLLFWSEDGEGSEGITLIVSQLTESSSEGAGCPTWGTLVPLSPQGACPRSPAPCGIPTPLLVLPHVLISSLL